MSKRGIGQEILEGIPDIKALTAGKKTLRSHIFTKPAAPQVIRSKLNLSQATFAGLMGLACALSKIGSKDAER